MYPPFPSAASEESVFDHSSPTYSQTDARIITSGGLEARMNCPVPPPPWNPPPQAGVCDAGYGIYWSYDLAGCVAYNGHDGIDYGVSYRPLYAAADSDRVMYAGWWDPQDHTTALGIYVKLHHVNGYITSYGHMSSIAVQACSTAGCSHVPKGEVLGISGNTGNSTGSHLHYPFQRDDLDCDYFGTSLHKWLSAPVGTAFVYVRREKIPRIWSLFASPPEMAGNIRKFENIGTFPVHIRNPITEAVDFWEAIGPERKAARLRLLRRRWTNAVQDLPGVKILTPDDDAQSCALGAMTLDGVTGPRLTDWLMARHRVHVRPREVPNEFSAIRVTPNVYTTLEEVDVFARAVVHAATKGIG